MPEDRPTPQGEQDRIWRAAIERGSTATRFSELETGRGLKVIGISGLENAAKYKRSTWLDRRPKKYRIRQGMDAAVARPASILRRVKRAHAGVDGGTPMKGWDYTYLCALAAERKLPELTTRVGQTNIRAAAEHLLHSPGSRVARGMAAECA